MVAQPEQPLPPSHARLPSTVPSAADGRAGRGGAQQPSGDQEDAADPEHDPAQQPEAEGDEHAARQQAEQPGHHAISLSAGAFARLAVQVISGCLVMGTALFSRRFVGRRTHV